MIAPSSPADTCHAALMSCLRTLADGCQGLEQTTPSLHRLRSLVMVLQPVSTIEFAPVGGGVAFTDALRLASTAQGLLSVLEDAGAASAISAEMMRILAETLVELVSAVGAKLRQQQAVAHRSRGTPSVGIAPTGCRLTSANRDPGRSG